MANILASKLFISSNRQDKILAAIANPINSELVKQVADYLDEEFIAPEYLDGSKSNDVLDDFSDESSEEDDDLKSFSGGSGGFSYDGFLGSPGENYLDDDSEGDGEETDPLADFDDASGDSGFDDTSDDVPLEESTAIMGSKCAKSLEGSLESIQGLLNSRESTKGVQRICIKAEELWIYYSDDVNLNNVMTFVVDLLAASNYSVIEFNRLARSNNAMVFDILDASTPIQPVEGGSDE